MQEGGGKKRGCFRGICHFDPGDPAVVCWGITEGFFPLDLENKFSCFFDIGERFFPGFTQADRVGNLHARDRETSFFRGFEHHSIFHRCPVFSKECAILL